ncbi:MAG: hypothetical protein JXL97_09650 [Bacteroidales bacterium]|nr:hypothetical protein [Bacteroidales bacterium]
MEYIVGFPKIEHVDQLVFLNKKFLVDNLDPIQREKGFIRIEYSKEDFEKIVTAQEIVTAFNFDEIVAYYLIGKNATTQQIDYQRNMAKKIAKSNNIPEEKIGYSCQVCINKDFRHLGLFKNMLELLSKSAKEKYSHLLCSISDKNIASLKAHKKNGWTYIDKSDTTNFFIYDNRI